ncbi:hypothetical protein EDO6_02277 [Paenibacillus xylanexedens]|nr:hypothetical protein EDO6_02277 [Paenibacillus xylanexedens]
MLYRGALNNLEFQAVQGTLFYISCKYIQHEAGNAVKETFENDENNTFYYSKYDSFAG